MTHTLTFSKKYKSLLSFNSVELPDFTLVTGENGSGKSQLLEAIEKGFIQCSELNNTSEAALYTWATLSMADQEPAQPGVLSRFGEAAYESLKQLSRKQNKEFSIAIDGQRKNLTTTSIVELVRTANGDERARLAAAIRVFIANTMIDTLNRADQRKPVTIFTKSISDEDIFSMMEIVSSGNEIQIRNTLQAIDGIVTNGFEQSLNRIFQNYRDIENRNTVAIARNLPDQTVTLPGPPPWEFMNNIFEAGNIPFYVDAPNYVEINSSVQVNLRKSSTNTELKFSDLSSGERIFMSFAIALYNSSNLKERAIFPKLLLLDEIDATLHPSMVNYVLRVIKETMIEEMGMKVILTTHSPTTVSLTQDHEVFEMRGSEGCLEQIGRAKAIRVLTEALPTLAIDYDCRAVVFTEDENDAELWSILYSGLKSRAVSDVSLTFLGSGVRSQKGETEGGGCNRVQSLVKNMTDAGVRRVVGMVDWDLRHKSDTEERLHVLCEGERYAIENLLLDPVLCIRLMCKRFPETARRECYLDHTEGERSLDDWPQEVWQAKVDKFCTNVLPDKSDQRKTCIEYANGYRLNLNRSYLSHNGHRLQKKIVECYGCFNSFDAQKKLLKTIATQISNGDCVDLFPKAIIDTIDELADLATTT
ncbi:AAA family ATPase [Phaeobacter inhibens]|uniref:AAA family ATPase n=1 Tax=Phaeobacter inhibens TaxID=221822 RepID=UPI0021A968AE|nr:AAA family ATPase [Phaeobacter inhibens]UWR87000.1 AAA family ATPase [Phaeobacter inhibens]